MPSVQYNRALPMTTPTAQPRRVRLGVLRAGWTDGLLVAIVVLAGVFYEWTSHTSAGRGYSPNPLSTSFYYMLAGSFLHLHLYMPIPPAPALLRLANPYDPSQNGAYAVHDLILFDGRYYLSWLPGPVITLYLPLRLLGVVMTDANAVPIFSFLALVFATLSWRALVRRYAQAAREWVILIGACALAFGTAVPFVLRRPAIYEVTVTAGACFLMVSLYCVIRGFADPRRPRVGLLVCAGVGAGLAFASRPTMVAVLIPLALIAAAFWRWSGAPLRLRRRVAVALLAPMLLSIALIGWYNDARFGSPTQYGLPYQLASQNQRNFSTLNPTYLPTGLYDYLLAPPRLAVTFPYVFLPPPPSPPMPAPSNALIEPTGGIIPMEPIVLFVVALPFLYWRHRRRAGPDRVRDLSLVASGLGLLGVVIVVGIAVSLPGTTERYEVDFDLLLTLAGLLAWLALLRTVGSRFRRALVKVVGVVLIAWGCITGVATSITGYYNLLDKYHPGVFAALEDVTSPLPVAATVVLGRPVIARIEDPGGEELPPTSYATVTAGGSTAGLGSGPLTMVIDSPGSQWIDVVGRYIPRAGIPQPSSIIVESPGEHPIAVPIVQLSELSMPVHLHFGLNRVQIGTSGGQPDFQTSVLADLNLKPIPAGSRP